MIDLIGEIIIMFVFHYPGAGIRWLVSRLWGSKRTFKDFAMGDVNVNAFVGLFTLALFLVLSFILRHL